MRPNSPELDTLLTKVFPVLDKGFIRIVDYMGNDSSIVQAARVSYGTGTKQVSQDKALINYLMEHYHTTPFEMAQIKVHVKLPIFVARQWMRHRTGTFNEYSARYSVMDKEFYLPDASVVAEQSTTNKQGRIDNPLPEEDANRIIGLLNHDAKAAYDTYSLLLEDSRLSREIARINLPVNFYTQFYWTVNLHNLLHFCKLRADSHAQYEIQQYAKVLLDIVKAWVPHTFEAFMEHRVNSVTFSAKEMKILKNKLKGIEVGAIDSELSKRQQEKFNKKLDTAIDFCDSVCYNI